MPFLISEDELQCSEEFANLGNRTAIRIRIKQRCISDSMYARNHIRPSNPQFKDARKLCFHKTRWITRRQPKLENSFDRKVTESKKYRNDIYKIQNTTHCRKKEEVPSMIGTFRI